MGGASSKHPFSVPLLSLGATQVGIWFAVPEVELLDQPVYYWLAIEHPELGRGMVEGKGRARPLPQGSSVSEDQPNQHVRWEFQLRKVAVMLLRGSQGSPAPALASSTYLGVALVICKLEAVSSGFGHTGPYFSILPSLECGDIIKWCLWKWRQR